MLPESGVPVDDRRVGSIRLRKKEQRRQYKGRAVESSVKEIVLQTDGVEKARLSPQNGVQELRGHLTRQIHLSVRRASAEAPSSRVRIPSDPTRMEVAGIFPEGDGRTQETPAPARVPMSPRIHVSRSSSIITLSSGLTRPTHHVGPMLPRFGSGRDDRNSLQDPGRKCYSSYAP